MPLSNSCILFFKQHIELCHNLFPNLSLSLSQIIHQLILYCFLISSLRKEHNICEDACCRHVISFRPNRVCHRRRWVHSLLDCQTSLGERLHCQRNPAKPRHVIFAILIRTRMTYISSVVIYFCLDNDIFISFTFLLVYITIRGIVFYILAFSLVNVAIKFTLFLKWA